MKIFIVGSEGAGKTVFLAMLSRYLHEHSSGMVLEPADFQTSQYIVNVQQALENGEWPPSTRMGQSFVLKWNFGGVGRTIHQLLMYDAAGQDLRTLMLAEDLEDLSAQDKGGLAAFKCDPGDPMGLLREQIHNSDVLVYLLDLEPFLGTSDRQIQNEHCWLLKTFLAHPRWKDKKRIVLLSKKDKYEALLAESGNDVRMCVTAHLPSFYSVTHHLDKWNVQFSAVSSIATECVLDADGTPLRMPCRPFRPGDMSGFARFLADIAGGPPSLPSPADHSAEKVACASCGAAIQKTTSTRHGGKCAICAKKTPTGQGTGCLLAILAVLGSSSCIVCLVLGIFCS
jgi:hypothetical protein